MTNQASTQELHYAVSDINFVAPHFPQYEFRSLMAEGSMGACFKVIQSKLERKVAMKVIARRIGREQTFADAFTAHAVASAKLNHPNLVQLYDFGETEEMLYMVSEYVSGTTLDKATNGKPVDLKQVLAIMTGIGYGMAHAHKHDIVHGDLQPSTILVSPDIEAKINDFGLAMSLRTQGDVTSAPLNPHFAAPEIYYGETHGDRLTDVYSMGAIMYYLLTAIPYEAGAPKASSVSTCDARYDKIIELAMHEDRLQRYGSVNEFLEQLEQLKQRNPLITAPVQVKAAPLSSAQTRPKAAAYITSLAASQNQTVRVVKRPTLHVGLGASSAAQQKFSFPLAG